MFSLYQCKILKTIIRTRAGMDPGSTRSLCPRHLQPVWTNKRRLRAGLSDSGPGEKSTSCRIKERSVLAKKNHRKQDRAKGRETTGAAPVDLYTPWPHARTRANTHFLSLKQTYLHLKPGGRLAVCCLNSSHFYSGLKG